ncbi:uncharacterized protein TM35_000132010 [Trypanosoma theileri]|uniref:Endonuclease/exonuclease/phosphatase domain-containing protein n=1 Tax=Trypanosoma theileri TaxID=67003 RepID=A0A1X0NWW0_9TRYP|nr:uncharacterized protein TM35_000132010 [Trypanosoma theileri]ORC89197.1 hypothetical protein TM35_000132010 [Trypanosoma theileri]
MARISHLISIVRRLDPHALVAGDANLHHDIWDSRLPASKEGEDFATTLVDLGFEVVKNPLLATRTNGTDSSSPDVTFSRSVTVDIWLLTPYMDSDHCLISYPLAIGEGEPSVANTLPRRKSATFALRKADRPNFTSKCDSALANATTWHSVYRGILCAAKQTIPKGSRDNPRTIWTEDMDLASQQAKCAFQAHLATPYDDMLLDAFIWAKDRQTSAFRRGIQLLMESRAQKLGAPCTSQLALFKRIGGIASSPTFYSGSPIT